MYTIGPYRFSDTDAHRTIASAPIIRDLMLRGLDRDAVARLVPGVSHDPATPGDPTDRDQVAAALREVWELILAIGPALRTTGQLGAPREGVVAHLHRSDGGVPKTPVHQVEVGWRGVAGDRQNAREHHGRPWQALCLWSGEVIDAFAASGHPIVPGAAGENITLRSIPWDEVRPGRRLRMGAVLCEVSAWAVPCRKNARWFTDGDFGRLHHDRGPVSRAYATVLEPGTITTGDTAALD